MRSALFGVVLHDRNRPNTFCTVVECSNHWATKDELALGHMLGSYMTTLLRTARISSVESVMRGNVQPPTGALTLRGSIPVWDLDFFFLSYARDTMNITSYLFSSSIYRGPQMRIFFPWNKPPGPPFVGPGGLFQQSKKSEFESPLYILLAYFKGLSRAVKSSGLSRISATFLVRTPPKTTPQTERLIPPKDPLFGALWRTVTNWRNHYPLHIPRTTGDNQFCQIKKSIYVARPRRQERGVFANANISQRDLIAWLDAQEQKPFLRVAPINETVEAFDPLHMEPEAAPAQRERGFDEFTLPERIVDLYNVGEWNKVEGWKPGEQSNEPGKQSNGVLIEHLQNLLCLKW